MPFIDINCDLGEGMFSDSEIVPYISSASIACGGHFGTAETISNAIAICTKHQVATGAHPSYPDTENFGRKTISIPSGQLMGELKMQIDLFKKICIQAGISMHHIKLHGALYSDMANDEKLIFPFLELIRNHYPHTLVYGLAGSMFTTILKENGIKVAEEAFADRAYKPDGTLVPRSETGSVLTGKQEITEQVLGLILEKQINTLNKTCVRLMADTVCIHSDTPDAAGIAKTVHAALQGNDIIIKALPL
jgi:UPF0271 protein